MAKPKRNNPQSPLQEPRPEFDDRPEFSFASGEPKEAGRSHGHLIDDDGDFAGRPEDLPPHLAGENPDAGDDWESGRHQAAT